VNAFRSKKRLGQHLLRYTEDARRIASLLGADSAPQTIVEIGPGAGALTTALVELYPKAEIIAVEFDRDLLSALERRFAGAPRVRFIQEDILKVDLTRFGSTMQLIGNLPYNISAPIIQWTVAQRAVVSKAVFMLQREVAGRLCSEPGGKDWSPLAIHTQLRFDVTREFDLAPDRFEPPPKVNSTVFTLSPIKTTERFPDFDEYRAKEFEQLVRSSFGARRKSLVNNLINGYGFTREEVIAILESAGIDKQSRAEQLGIGEFIRLLQSLQLRR